MLVIWIKLGAAAAALAAAHRSKIWWWNTVGWRTAKASVQNDPCGAFKQKKKKKRVSNVFYYEGKALVSTRSLKMGKKQHTHAQTHTHTHTTTTATNGKKMTEIYDHSRDGFWESGTKFCWFTVMWVIKKQKNPIKLQLFIYFFLGNTVCWLFTKAG